MGNWEVVEDGADIDVNKYTDYRQYDTIAERDAASAGWGSSEIFRECQVVETGYKYYWNGAAWMRFPSEGGAGAPADASYVTVNAEAGLSGETQHVNIPEGNKHTPKLHAASHQNAGADELDVSDLSGVLADEQDAGFIKGVAVTAAPGAGDDQKLIQYDHGTTSFRYAAAAGGGDMLKATYDADLDNVVDNSEKLEGSTKAQVQNHTPIAHVTRHITGGADPFTAAHTLECVARTTIRKNSGANVGSRRRINLIEGTGCDLTVNDDPGNEEVDVIISASGSGSQRQLATFNIIKVGSNYIAVTRAGLQAYTDTDCAVVLQDIVDNETRWHVHFEDGTYTFYSPVDFAAEDRFMISGCGWATEIKLGANLGTGVNFWEFDHTTFDSGRFIIKDLYFNMDATSYTSQDCLSFDGGNDFIVQNIFILKPHRDGINIFESTHYTMYAEFKSIHIKYAGRYGVYCNARDNEFRFIKCEYNWDSGFVFGTSGAGNSLWRLFAAGANNTGEYAGNGVPGGHGGGSSRYAGLEVLGSGNTVHGMYLDRNKKNGAYMTGNNNGVLGGRCYQNNYNQADGNNYDIYSNGAHCHIIGVELTGQASHRTIYGVELGGGSSTTAVLGCTGYNHSTALTHDGGAGNDIDHCLGT